MGKRYSILEALADKTKKPDALGFQPFDPELLRAAGFKVFDLPRKKGGAQ